jgi:hypothetical protein
MLWITPECIETSSRMIASIAASSSPRRETGTDTKRKVFVFLNFAESKVDQIAFKSRKSSKILCFKKKQLNLIAKESA